ncbi:heavy metal-associated isoprenylated plant protein 43-like [Oryza brachyantha]|uniref:HMA domain-containing protein n=1 Tax=Oryza brachyantha TaxID=4533 RepID=J3KY98_ORYBR|nr:heavy metal-associated isoprenylated plant protein 43-like [Oryza brachyantha]
MTVSVSKKTVIRADLIGSSCKVKIIHAVAMLEGIKSIDVDEEKCTLTVLGPVDPVKIVRELKKRCFAAAVVSVEEDKPKEPDPPAPAPEKEEEEEECVKVCVASCCHSPCVLPDCYFYKAYKPPPSPSFGLGYHLQSEGQCAIQ